MIFVIVSYYELNYLIKDDMNKFILLSLTALFLTGCSEPKKINMADYGFKEEGTLYVKKVDSVSAIYEKVSYYRNDGGYPNTVNCIEFAYDGQTKTFCHDMYAQQPKAYGNSYTGNYYYPMVDEKDKPNLKNMEDLKRLEKKFHQVANDHSVFDSLSELISKFK